LSGFVAQDLSGFSPRISPWKSVIGFFVPLDKKRLRRIHRYTSKAQYENRTDPVLPTGCARMFDRVFGIIYHARVWFD